jgi:hypothetical protein
MLDPKHASRGVHCVQLRQRLFKLANLIVPELQHIECVVEVCLD